MSQARPKGMPIARGTALLVAKGLDPHPSSNNGRGEVWLWPDQESEYIPYVGPPYGIEFLESAILEVISKRK